MENRVIVYIDGFNLYFGLKSKAWRKYYWLDLDKLSKKLLKPDQILIEIKYFTARIEQPEDKRKRQNMYIEALETLSNLNIFYGKYLSNPVKCRNCGYIFMKPSEKETDVNIAIELISDAIRDKFDTALIISGDSDLVPAIRRTKEIFPVKKIISIFPPLRNSFELKKVTDGNFVLSEHKIKKSQFPNIVPKSNGYIIQKPTSWI
jgi:uncharacterized LabA/DUF88 family protein